MNALRFPSSRRTGWSYLQVVTYLVAVSAGVWLGAYYIGVPVEEIAYTALDKSTLLERIPPEHRPETPAGLVQDPEQQRKQEEQLAGELKNDLADLHRELAELQTSDESTTKYSPEDANQAKRTLGYWNALRGICNQVSELSDGAKVTSDPLSASRVLQVRGKAFRYGAKAISALDPTDVDPQAVELGQSLATWYGNGANLYEQTLAGWEGELEGQSGLSDATGLDTIQQQFEQETALLRVKSAETSSRLSRRFGTEFSPIP